MQIPRRRLTVRAMMVAVALVAVFLGAIVEIPRLWIRHRQFRDLAEKYGYWAARLKWTAEIRQEITHYSIHQPRGPEPSPARLSRMQQEASYFAGLRDKYDRAARYPWLVVAPDPPPP